MANIRLTKMSLREEERRLKQLKNYLPTLQLKKTLLQSEVNKVRDHVEKLHEELWQKKQEVEEFAELIEPCNLLQYTKIANVNKYYENIAGVETPNFINLSFQDFSYNLYDSPVYLDSAVDKMRSLIETNEKIHIEEEKERALQKELNDVSVRVNLFEKILIPRTEKNIRKIKIFLSDQELASISRMKVAKNKILEKK